ncbi:MAG: hypothetical protein MZV70_01800 [Desulfobacterales bacterium]|nr:hypothetical protein [Desulfobacterales bacterium]
MRRLQREDAGGLRKLNLGSIGDHPIRKRPVRLELPHRCRPSGSVLLAGILAASPGVLAEVLLGRVVAIADGDTLTVLDAAQHTAPRYGFRASTPREVPQPFGQRSRQNLRRSGVRQGREGGVGQARPLRPHRGQGVGPAGQLPDVPDDP